jgi:hypothetical protein
MKSLVILFDQSYYKNAHIIKKDPYRLNSIVSKNKFKIALIATVLKCSYSILSFLLLIGLSERKRSSHTREWDKKVFNFFPQQIKKNFSLE